MYSIETKNLTKKFGEKTAVSSLDLAIRENELFGLLGVNGAGKTTAIRMLCRMLKPTAGEILVRGQNMDDFSAKKIINFSPQETAVAPNLTVKENLELIAGMYGFSSSAARNRAEKVIDEFYLREVENQRAKTLSGGLRRRLSIAMAMVTEPEILFLDEPTLGLDVIARRELWHVISQLKGRITIILTTHYLEEAEALCDRIGIMEGGKLKSLGTVKEIERDTKTASLEEAFIRLAGIGTKE